MSNLPAFLLAALVLLVIPGPAVLYIVTRSVAQGRRAGLASVLGIELASLCHALAAAFGLSALLLASSIVFGVVKYLGAAYLVYLGIRALVSREPSTAAQDVPPASLGQLTRKGFLVNLLNPKTALFFYAFLPQFVSVDEAAAWPRMLELSSVFMLVTLVVFVIYGLLAAGVRNRILSRPRVMAWVRRIFAGSFVALAGRLAFTNR